MEIYQLELFLAVVKEGNLTKAARDRGLSPSAMSQQLQKLSEELEIALFRKAGRGIALTRQGELFVKHARRVLEEVDEMRKALAEEAKSGGGEFHFATGASPLLHGLAKPLRAFRKRFPKVQMRVTVASTETMVEGVLRGNIDLALISMPIADERLSLIPLYEEEMFVLQPSERALKGWKVGEIEARELEQQPMLLYPPTSNMRKLIDERLAELGVRPKVSMEMADTEMLVRLVEAGMGQSILPEMALRRSSRHFRIARIKGARIQRRQAFVMARGAYVRGITTTAAEFLKRELLSNL